MMSPSESTTCAIYVDMGTTNTRAWLMQGPRVIASTREAVGVRNSARNAASASARETLREILGKLRRENIDRGEQYRPTSIAAAGMITSSLGLRELPHIRPPAGLEELQASAEWHSFPDVFDLPMLLVPGVRCGPEHASVASVDELDVMRGEETLCAGLTASGIVAGPATVMNFGSHWKAIHLNEKGRIVASVTSLSGELIHASQQNTVLAGSVTQDWPAQFPEQWIQSGMREQRRSGLSRSAFCARLLDLERLATREDRLAFLVGAFIASDLDALLAQKFFQEGSTIALVGSSAIAYAWQYALGTASLPSIVIHQNQTENAFLTALRLILEYRLSTTPDSIHSRRTYSS